MANLEKAEAHFGNCPLSQTTAEAKWPMRFDPAPGLCDSYCSVSESVCEGGGCSNYDQECVNAISVTNIHHNYFCPGVVTANMELH